MITPGLTRSDSTAMVAARRDRCRTVAAASPHDRSIEDWNERPNLLIAANGVQREIELGRLTVTQSTSYGSAAAARWTHTRHEP